MKPNPWRYLYVAMIGGGSGMLGGLMAGIIAVGAVGLIVICTNEIIDAIEDRTQ